MAYKQNLQGAQGGTIRGAHGGTQQLGAAARARLGAPGPNTAGGGLNPTPPTMDPAQKPPAWQALQQAGIGGQGSAAANRAAAAGLQQPQMQPVALPGFQPIGDGPNVSHPTNPGTGLGPTDQMQGGAPAMNLAGHTPVFGSGAMQGVGDAADQMQQAGGPNVFHPTNPEAGQQQQMPAGGPLPGFQAAPGTIPLGGGPQRPPIMSLPGPSGKFPLQPGLPTKPLPIPTGRPLGGLGGLGGGGGLDPGNRLPPGARTY